MDQEETYVSSDGSVELAMPIPVFRVLPDGSLRLGMTNGNDGNNWRFADPVDDKMLNLPKKELRVPIGSNYRQNIAACFGLQVTNTPIPDGKAFREYMSGGKPNV